MRHRIYQTMSLYRKKRSSEALPKNIYPQQGVRQPNSLNEKVARQVTQQLLLGQLVDDDVILLLCRIRLTVLPAQLDCFILLRYGLLRRDCGIPQGTKLADARFSGFTANLQDEGEAHYIHLRNTMMSLYVMHNCRVYLFFKVYMILM